MVIIASTLVDILVAAPIGFLFGLLFGIFVASKYVVIRPRNLPSEYRDYHDRGDRPSD